MIPLRPELDRAVSRSNGGSAAIRRAGVHRCTVCDGLMNYPTADNLCNSYACWVRAGVIKEPRGVKQ